MPRPKHADRQVQERIASCVREARIQKGWTQEELAEALEVATETVSRYEGGRSPPSLPMLYRIAEALGIDVGLLIDPESTDLTQAETQLIKGWRRLDPKAQSLVLNLIEHLSSRVGADPGGRPTALHAPPSQGRQK
jgi:transcriptional regulator with XRE-family HTH domain